MNTSNTPHEIFLPIQPQTIHSDYQYQDKIRKIISELHQSKFNIDKFAHYYVKIIFYFKKIKTRRIDLDNLAKPILDALKGKIYKDDWQVYKLALEKKTNELFNGIAITYYYL